MDQLKQLYNQFDQTVFGSFDENQSYDTYIELLKSEIHPECQTILDVGCGDNSPVKFMSDKLDHTVGVDLYQQSIDASRQAGIHDEYFTMDVLNIQPKFASKSFDCVLATDIIEHLDKTAGLNLLRMMEDIARKKVIIYTPNGYIPQHEYDNNELQVHRSGWTAKELKMRGYQVIGMNGLKYLKGERAQIRFRPALFWGRISQFTQKFTFRYPQLAYQILCIKNI